MGVGRGVQQGHLPPTLAIPALAPSPSCNAAQVFTPQEKILPTPMGLHPLSLKTCCVGTSHTQFRFMHMISACTMLAEIFGGLKI